MNLDTVPQRIEALRQLMDENGIDVYYVNTADAHQSEYIADYYTTRRWLSGFTGSAGFMIVTQDEAELWADGRYYIQAEEQLKGSGIKLMRLGSKGVPNLKEELKRVLPQAGTLGFDGRMISQTSLESLEKALAEKDCQFRTDLDLVGEIWTDRPALPDAKLFVHELKFTGQTAAEKIDAIREKMAEDGCDASLMVSLDNVAWTTNLRGGDVEHTPVFLSYLLITPDHACLFVDPLKVTPDVKQMLKENKIDLMPYTAIDRELKDLQAAKLQVDPRRLSSYHWSLIPDDVECLRKESYAYEMKACLNETELASTREAMIRDSAVVTKHLHWVKHEAVKEGLNEYEVQTELTHKRQSLPNFLDESFTTISAYGPNAAMMHYSASEDDATVLKEEGLYLCDCGSQFFDGTTDITRTIALGPVSDEMKKDFTYTLKSHIQLASTVFKEGTTGTVLDGITRAPLWKQGFDYKCGTGHGVGYVLGVHEGPQRIANGSKAPLKPGMVVTNEPGVYKEGMYGIRLENDYVITDLGEDTFQHDRYFGLEYLTFVPFDRDAIELSYLRDDEIEWLDAYHAACYEHLSKELPEEDQTWLKEICAPLTK